MGKNCFFLDCHLVMSSYHEAEAVIGSVYPNGISQE